jgi:uncharacterized surface protein with fasciclin (FAS1) repeats
MHIIDKVLTIPVNASTTIADAGLSAAYGALSNASLLVAVDSLKDATLFVPSNDAFSAIGSGFVNLSTADLTTLLEYHAVNGTTAMYSNSLKNGLKLTSIMGQPLTIYDNNGTFFVNNAKIIYPNLLTSGGVIHVIDE